ASKMLNVASKMLNVASKMLNVASKMLNVASKMQSLRHGFAKRTTARIAPLLILRFKCRTIQAFFILVFFSTQGCQLLFEFGDAIA
ncbi:MAG: hypothetical protein RID53_32830, partial [Coleofasciculus sp. B1-GNL1-01]|uniref:hypothetical protein n=1 Tax=Coleofasciculus sp. B1-GNL1-01 TaxID=3068484 RepID=UPI0032F60400